MAAAAAPISLSSTSTMVKGAAHAVALGAPLPAARMALTALPDRRPAPSTVVLGSGVSPEKSATCAGAISAQRQKACFTLSSVWLSVHFSIHGPHTGTFPTSNAVTLISTCDMTEVGQWLSVAEVSHTQKPSRNTHTHAHTIEL